MTAHEYASGIAEGQTRSDYDAQQKWGASPDGNLASMRARKSYLQAHDRYCAAQVWASMRGIELTGPELVRVYQESRLVRV